MAVLLKVYANCIDGEEAPVNEKIERALAASRGAGAHRGEAAPSGYPAMDKPAGQAARPSGERECSVDPYESYEGSNPSLVTGKPTAS